MNKKILIVPWVVIAISIIIIGYSVVRFAFEEPQVEVRYTYGSSSEASDEKTSADTKETKYVLEDKKPIGDESTEADSSGIVSEAQDAGELEELIESINKQTSKEEIIDP